MMVKIKGLRGMRMDRQRIELVEIVDVFGCMFGSEDRKYAQSLNSGKQARTTIAKSRLNKLSSCRHGTNACMYLLHTRALDGSTRRVFTFKFAVQRAPHFGQLSCRLTASLFDGHAGAEITDRIAERPMGIQKQMR